jgi:hypothetical protein
MVQLLFHSRATYRQIFVCPLIFGLLNYSLQLNDYQPVTQDWHGVAYWKALPYADNEVLNDTLKAQSFETEDHLNNF